MITLYTYFGLVCQCLPMLRTRMPSLTLWAIWSVCIEWPTRCTSGVSCGYLSPPNCASSCWHSLPYGSYMLQHASEKVMLRCMKDWTMVASATAFKTSWEIMLRMSCCIHIHTPSYRPYSCFLLLCSSHLMILMTVSSALERTQIANTPASSSQEKNVPEERWSPSTALVIIGKAPIASLNKSNLLLIAGTQR